MHTVNESTRNKMHLHVASEWIIHGLAYPEEYIFVTKSLKALSLETSKVRLASMDISCWRFCSNIGVSVHSLARTIDTDIKKQRHVKGYKWICFLAWKYTDITISSRKY